MQKVLLFPETKQKRYLYETYGCLKDPCSILGQTGAFAHGYQYKIAGGIISYMKWQIGLTVQVPVLIGL
ncbi:hypothetical protein GW17_00007678 [Ensete ventricosum]|uniref:Uncharacterized protein n=1 Tax=Ensete ventricosum TaxID=4639 RepID=A0A444FZ28_ENSVE|nr:hypothetical protein GW17_00007678 [Ensete ventricosum]RZR72405.1 hypothetical protein BHM03_00013260 [Ensete ventricosum]